MIELIVAMALMATLGAALSSVTVAASTAQVCTSRSVQAQQQARIALTS